MIDKEAGAVNQLSKILTAIKANSDQELVLIGNLDKQIDFIATKLGGVTASLDHVNANLNDIDSNIQTATTKNDNRANTGSGSSGEKAQAGDVTSIGGSQLFSATTNTSAISHSETINNTNTINNGGRSNEVTATPTPRKKPTFKADTQQVPITHGTPSTQGVDQVVAATEQTVTVSQAAIKQNEETSNVLADYWRDEKGRLRNKSGRYASSDESKAYETAEREQQKKESKSEGLIARFVGSFNKPQNAAGDSDVKEIAGAAAGGSMFYAMREMYTLAGDIKGVFTTDADQTNDPITSIGNGPANNSNSADSSSSANTNSQGGGTAREKSNRKQELRHQAEQTETLKEQTAEQAKHYEVSVNLLDEIARNTKPEGESLLESIGTVGSILSGGMAAIAGLAGLAGLIGLGKGNDKGKGKPGIKVATEIKPTPGSSVLANGSEKTPKAKGSLLSKAGSLAKGGAKGLASKLPFIGAIVTLGESILSLKDRDDLDPSQKTAKVASTAGGAALGATAGTMAGGAAGAFLGTLIMPVVGTAVGGTIGKILGGAIGTWVGGKAGDAAGDNLSNAMKEDRSIGDTLTIAWDDTVKSSESTLKTVFGGVFSSLFGSDEDPKITPNDYSKTDYQKGDVIDQRIDKFNPIIDRESEKNGVRPKLIKAVIRQESAGVTDAKSGVGASGLMQLMPRTAKELGVKDSTDPEQNIAGGAKYLAQHIKKYSKKGYSEDDATKLALASYNAGSGWVDAAIKKSGNSMDGEAVLASLRDPSLEFGGKTRSASNIKQSDDYVKKVYSNYSAMSDDGVVASDTQHAQNVQSVQSAPNAQRVHSTAISSRTESVNDIDTKNLNTPKPPEKVIITNQPKPPQAIKTVKAANSSNSTTNNNTTLNSSNLVASNTVIPTDFDDVSLRLQGWDRN